MKRRLNEITEAKLKLDETDVKEVDGVNVLGKVKGQFFVPNGASRNERFYSRALWEKCINSTTVQERLKNRRMFGTISHEQEIDDEAIREGKISHVMTKLYIDGNGDGCGEALLLATPTGKVLNTMLRAGCGLFVSSRADGDYTGELVNGLDEVDSDSYVLHGFDFVSEPGFLEANPKIAEALLKVKASVTNKDENKGENDTMHLDEKLFNKLLEDNNKLKADFEKTLDENKKILAEMSNLQSIVAEKANDSNSLKESVVKLTDELKVANDSLVAKTAELEVIEAAIVEYKAIGESKVISETIDKAVAELKAYKALGTVEDLNKGIDKATEKLKAYAEIGTVAELTEALNKSDKITTKVLKEEEEKEIEKISIELEVPSETVQKFLDKGIDLADVKELISDLLTDAEVEPEVTDSDVEDDDYSAMDDYEATDDSDVEDEEETFETSESKVKRMLSIMESAAGRVTNKK